MDRWQVRKSDTQYQQTQQPKPLAQNQRTNETNKPNLADKVTSKGKSVFPSTTKH